MTATADGAAQAEAKVRPETTLRALVNLWPYMWPSDRPDLKRRVAVALAILVAAKVITVLVPYTYKWATDALVTPTTSPDGSLAVGVGGALFVPIMLIVAYGVGRILMNVFNNLRDALFAKVGQHAVRQLAYKTFVHMHQLSLRFHLERRTGGLSRIIERGTNGIESIVRFTILNTLPTLFEFAFAAAVIAWQFDIIYLL
ncbi:MAG TPA: ABC transporter transmembrane domain-containing protein, partial [Bauldia sp.]|nr:ABC transporter transmembrane domain-containing protein [Bauldia sp.]